MHLSYLSCSRWQVRVRRSQKIMLITLSTPSAINQTITNSPAVAKEVVVESQVMRVLHLFRGIMRGALSASAYLIAANVAALLQPITTLLRFFSDRSQVQLCILHLFGDAFAYLLPSMSRLKNAMHPKQSRSFGFLKTLFFLLFPPTKPTCWWQFMRLVIWFCMNGRLYKMVGRL